MPSKLAETTSRNFNPMSAPGLSDEARKAVKAAFDAMSTWRMEIVNDNEKNLERQDCCRCASAWLAGANRRDYPRANANYQQDAASNDG